jgi:hypothetical protein
VQEKGGNNRFRKEEGGSAKVVGPFATDRFSSAQNSPEPGRIPELW